MSSIKLTKEIITNKLFTINNNVCICNKPFIIYFYRSDINNNYIKIFDDLKKQFINIDFYYLNLDEDIVSSRLFTLGKAINICFYFCSNNIQKYIDKDISKNQFVNIINYYFNLW